MFLDVKLSSGELTRLTLCDGDDYVSVVEEFARLHSLSDRKKLKLATVIKYQLNSMLASIQEDPSVHEDETTLGIASEPKID